MSGPVAGAQAAFAAAVLDPQAPLPDGIRAWNGSDPARRFAVYRNNVLSSLVGALASTFPVVQALVGEEFFAAMAAVFVRQAPPRSRLLVQFGRGFADFIDGFGPAASVPYLADVARLEMARVEAFHAADATPLTGEAAGLALAAGERIGELRPGLHPSMRLVGSAHAIVSVWAAHQGAGDLAGVDPGVAETALVLRPGLEVLVLRCDAGSAAFAAALMHGDDLAHGAGAAAAAAPAFDLSATLALLMTHGALTSLHLPQGEPP